MFRITLESLWHHFGVTSEALWHHFLAILIHLYSPLIEGENFEMDEDENTISLLNRYIDESEFDLDKNIIKGIFQDLYRQACEVE